MAQNIFQQETQRHLGNWLNHPVVTKLIDELAPCVSASDIDDAIKIINRSDTALHAWLVANRSLEPGDKHTAWVEGCLIMGQMRNARIGFWTLPGVV